LGIIVLAIACGGAVNLLQQLNSAGGIFVLGHFPVEDQRIARLQMRRFNRRLAFWLALPLALCCAIGLNHDFSWIGLARGGLAGLFPAVLSYVLALLLAAWAPPAILARAALPLAAAALAFLLFGLQFPQVTHYVAEVMVWVPAVPASAALLFPEPYVGRIFQLGGLLFFAGAIALAFFARTRLLHGFRWEEDVLIWTEVARAAETRTPLAAPEWSELFKADPEAMQTSIRDAVFLRETEWKHHGWVENMVARWWNPEERRVAEFLTGRHPKWSTRFRNLIIGIVVLVAAANVFGGLSALASTGFAVPLALFVLFWAMASGSASWPGLALQAGPGLQPPIYASYPVSFSQLFRVIIKANAIRLTMSLPVVALGLLAATRGEVSGQGFWLFVRLAVCGFVLLPASVIFPISQFTNDTRKVRVWLPALILGLMIAGSLGVFVWAPRPAWMVIALAGGAVSCWGAAALYGFLFNRGQIDLIPVRRAEDS
jgi:hypothetical protein